MPPEYVLTDAVGGVIELEPLEHLDRPGLGLDARHLVEPADHAEVLRPVRFSSTAAYWPASPITSRRASASRTTSYPGTVA